MSLKTQHKLTWLNESSFGTPSTDPIVAGTQTYYMGHFFENQKLPAPKVNLTRYSYSDDRDASQYDSANYKLQSKLKFYLVDGIPLYYAMGQSANTTPSYEQHVLTGCYANGSDEFDLPSFTLHHELINGTTQSHEYYGNKVNSLNVSAQRGQPVVCEMDLIASKVAVDRNVLTQAPAFPSTANETPFSFHKATFTWDSTGYTEIESFNIAIMNNLSPIWVHRATDEEFAKYIFEGNRSYAINLNLMVKTDTFIFDRLIDQTNKSFTILLNRGTNDEISFAFSNCYVTEHDDIFRVRGGDVITSALIIAKTLSITVQDQIGSSFYPTQS